MPWYRRESQYENQDKEQTATISFLLSTNLRIYLEIDELVVALVHVQVAAVALLVGEIGQVLGFVIGVRLSHLNELVRFKHRLSFPCGTQSPFMTRESLCYVSAYLSDNFVGRLAWNHFVLLNCGFINGPSTVTRPTNAYDAFYGSDTIDGRHKSEELTVDVE